jgi:RNA polymerase sigma factor (sigma-70 family)
MSTATLAVTRDAPATSAETLAGRFEEHRPHLRAVAYRLLGSLSESDDAVQEAWLRLDRSDPNSIDDLKGWLTTVIGRICLDMLRSRRALREEPFDDRLPDPIVSSYDADDPEDEALLGDMLGLALLVVLETLAPAERLAFVLHDMFAVPFDGIAAIVGRSPTATRKLASRARHRVQGAPMPDGDLGRQREAVDAFLMATRQGDFNALLAVLDPDVVLHADREIPLGAPTELRGAPAVAERALTFSAVAGSTRPARVNGGSGFILAPHGRITAVIGCTVQRRKIIQMDVIADPRRLRQLKLPVLGQD